MHDILHASLNDFLSRVYGSFFIEVSGIIFYYYSAIVNFVGKHHNNGLESHYTEVEITC